MTTPKPPAPFVLIVAGNKRLLLPKHYRFICTHLNRLLERRLSHIRLLSDAANSASLFAERWCEEFGGAVERFTFDPKQPIRGVEAQYLEWAIRQRPSGLVVFEAESADAGEIRRRARAAGIPVRIVDVRLVVKVPK
jgi:hypothetical protein